MRRITLLLTMATIMAVTTIALAGAAFADPPPEANASCFGTSESGNQDNPGPGSTLVAETAVAGAQTPPPGNQELAATLVRPLQEATHTTCQDGQNIPGNPHT